MIPSGDPAYEDITPELEPMTMIEAWTHALFKPSEETYVRVAYGPDASFWRAALWVFLASLAGLVIGTPIQLVLNPEMLAAFQEIAGNQNSALIAALGLMACLVPFTAFFGVIGMIISTAIYQLIARLLGGKGNFTALFNAYAAYGAPLALVSYIASAIPLVNLCISIPLAIYGLVLGIIAMKAVNRFSYGKAALVVLLPTLLAFTCVCLMIFALGASLAPVLGDPANWEMLLTPQP